MDSKSDSSGRRIVDLLAVAMTGDGALALVVPTGHIKTWICGPQRWRDLVRFSPSGRADALGRGRGDLRRGLVVRRSLNGGSRS